MQVTVGALAKLPDCMEELCSQRVAFMKLD